MPTKQELIIRDRTLSLNPTSPEQLVASIERQAGVLNIYDRDINGEFGPDVVERLRQARQKHFETIDDEHLSINMDAQAFADSIYRPRFIVLAREVAGRLIKSDWDKVSDILVAPVSIPVFNAAAVRSSNGVTAIIVHSPMFAFMPFINGLLWAAACATDDQNWSRLGELRRQMVAHVAAVLDMRKADHEALFRFPTVAEYKTAHDLLRLQSVFVLLHEYAHVICGHLDPCRTAARLASALLTGDVRLYTQLQEQEFEADAYALRALLAGTVDDIYVRVQPIFDCLDTAISSSLGVFFTLMCCIDAAVPSGDSHPSALERSAALQSMLVYQGHGAAAEELNTWADFARQFATA